MAKDRYKGDSREESVSRHLSEASPLSGAVETTASTLHHGETLHSLSVSLLCDESSVSLLNYPPEFLAGMWTLYGHTGNSPKLFSFLGVSK